MDAFAPRNAALEYWFWTFHAGDLAFLVDFIIRRKSNEAEIRVSHWVRGRGRVDRSRTTEWSIGPRRVLFGDATLEPEGSTGQVDGVSWDLRWDRGDVLVEPSPWLSRTFHLFDLEIVIQPAAAFRGSVTVDGETFEIEDTVGAFTHYWGRRLPDRWLWISAQRFDGEPARRLEALVNRPRIWGVLPVPFPVAYVWTTDVRSSDLTVSPLTGIIRQRRRDRGWSVDVRRLNGRRHTITCSADATTANDLGEGIHQTLFGDLTVDGVRATPGTAGIETRGWPL